MKKVLSAVLAVVLGLVAIDVVQASTTVTNRGQVITVQKATDTATDVRDLDVFQDMSTYATKPGQAGKIVRWYDFDKMGGAVATHKLLPAIPLPDNAVVRDGYIKVVTAVAPDNTTTEALGLNTTTDIAAAASNLVTSTGIKAVIPVGTAGTAVQLTDDRYLTYTIGAQAATAGKFCVVLDYELAP